MKHTLYHLQDIDEPGARSFALEGQHGDIDCFVLRWNGEVRAYLNRCPHTGVNLNWAEDQFFDIRNEYIQCSLHGALFEPLSGKCIWGPCVGGCLSVISVTVTPEQLLQLEVTE